MTDPELQKRACEVMKDLTLVRENWLGPRDVRELLSEVDQLLLDMALAIDVRDRTIAVTVAQLTRVVEKQSHGDSN